MNLQTGGGSRSCRMREWVLMSVATTSLRPSTSSPRVQMSMDREARSPQVGIRASVSKTGRPKSKVTKRRAPGRKNIAHSWASSVYFPQIFNLTVFPNVISNKWNMIKTFRKFQNLPVLKYWYLSTRLGGQYGIVLHDIPECIRSMMIDWCGGGCRKWDAWEMAKARPLPIGLWGRKRDISHFTAKQSIKLDKSI